MAVVCFVLLIVKLIYDGCCVAYASWYAENRNPYRAYRRYANNKFWLGGKENENERDHQGAAVHFDRGRRD